MKKKVLIVCHENTRTGGANQSLIDWLSENGDWEFDYHILLPQSKSDKNNAKSQFEELGLTVFEYPFLRETYQWDGPLTIRRVTSRYIRTLYSWVLEKRNARLIARALQPEAYSAILTNSHACSFGAIIAESIGVPHIWHIRENLNANHLYYPKSINVESMQRNSRAIFVSEYIEECAADAFPNYTVVHDRVFFQSIRRSVAPFSEDTIKVLSVGSLSRAKRHDVVIEAVAKLVNKGYPIRLHIYGEGELKAELSAQIERLEAERYVTLHGYCDTIGNVRSDADIAVTATECEALGRSSLEGMFSGSLLLASNAGFNKYLVESGVTGYLFKVNDSDDLARVMAEAISNPEESRRIAHAGELRARSFDRDIHERIEKIIHGAIYEQ